MVIISKSFFKKSEIPNSKGQNLKAVLANARVNSEYTTQNVMTGARVTLSLSLSLVVCLFVSSLVWAGIFKFFNFFKFFKAFYSFFSHLCGKIHKFTTLFSKFHSNFHSKIYIFKFLWIASACATPRNDELAGKVATPFPKKCEFSKPCICKARNDDYFYSKRFQFFEKSHFKG